MSTAHDRDLGMGRPISRRDFLDGVAVGIGALALGGGLAGCGVGGRDGAGADPARVPRPEDLTGLRGQSDAAFEVPHALRDGTFWDNAAEPEATGETYDLIVVGAGISGLAAARFWQRAEPDARILILDPLDQPGGHASQNDFAAGAGTSARTLIGYGGSQSIDSPSSYAKPAADLLADVDIQVDRFERYYDAGFNRRHGLGPSTFFDRETHGRDHLAKGSAPGVFRDAPLSPGARVQLERLYDAPPAAPFGDIGDTAIKEELTKLTYREFLERHAELGDEALAHLQHYTDDEWAYGIDGVGAIDAWADGYPGMRGMGLDLSRPYRTNAPTEWKLWDATDRYIYHFPQGNAGVARSIIRRLNPAAVPGTGMESIALAGLDYSQLDSEANAVRIRLRSPVVRVRNAGDEVEVTYSQRGQLRTVRGGQAVLACWSAMVPYICDEAPAEQAEALGFATKLSLMYANVQLRNWEAFAELGIHSAYSPNMYWVRADMDYPVSMGDYEFPDSPAEPILIHMPKAMVKPGHSPREQGKAGRAEMLGTPFEEIERRTRDQLARILAGGGFDPARDIEAITVNRWAHGYAYEYGRPWDAFWPDGPLPSEIARRPIGRIAIANSDSAPRAYVDSAIDMAWRAVAELRGEDPGPVARGVDGVTAA